MGYEFYEQNELFFKSFLDIYTKFMIFIEYS